MYIVHTVKKDGYMERYTQMIGKNVYTVRGKFGYLIVRKEDSLSVFLLYDVRIQYCYFVELYGMAWYTIYIV